MYSPKIDEALIPWLYQEAKSLKMPMTKLVNRQLRALKPVMDTEDLKILISGRKFLLDCGHTATPGHNFANTLIIVSRGGGRIETYCHECGY